MNLFQEITDQSIVLTPNRRLAAMLIDNYSQQQIKLNRKTWRTPCVMPIHAWIQAVWNDYSLKTFDENRIIINTQQELILWEEIIRESALADHLLQLSETAKLLKKALDMLAQWEIPLHHAMLSLTEDGKIFQGYAQQFEIVCKNNHWITPARLFTVLKELHIQNKIQPAEKMILYGFNELTPQQNAFFNLFPHVQTYKPENQNQQINKIHFSNFEEEVFSMARWAKFLLEKQLLDEKPQTCGCIFPKLEHYRDRVEQIFKEVLANQFDKINISAGKNLLSYPIIDAAFSLLQLNKSPLHIDKISQLLHSPFLGDAEKEKYRRARFDVELKNKNILYVSLTDLLHNFNLQNLCPLLAKRLERLCQHLDNFEQLQIKEQTAANPGCRELIEFFNQSLQILGWPGERSLNSQEYQVVHHAWLPLLSELEKVSGVTPKRFLHYLKIFCDNTLFQPQSPKAPIQILGLLEAAGMPFDYLWVSGLDDTCWPALPKPNPFIPLSLQKKYHLPNCSPERELAYSRMLTDQFVQNAKEIIFSYAETANDLPQRESSLIKDFPKISANDLALAEHISRSEVIYQSRSLESISDEYAPELLTHEKINTGARLFELQAACPFKAFAEIRLHAEKIESPHLGLKATERGTIIHNILESFWRSLKDQKTLMASTEDQLLKLVDEITQESLKKSTLKTNHRYLTVEKNRLVQLVFNWLEIEKKRADFKVVLQEAAKTITFAHIPINIRIDRVDELADGSYFIIDYKTGKTNDIKAWFGERIEAPQIPLYCMVFPEKISGIAYAQIHAKEMKLSGIWQEKNSVSKMQDFSECQYKDTESWKEQFSHWQQNLSKLAHNFREGQAAVDPKNKNKCTYCHLSHFCRINETENYDTN